jgi:hypothetical protein
VTVVGRSTMSSVLPIQPRKRIEIGILDPPTPSSIGPPAGNL